MSYCEIILIWISTNETELIVCRKSYRFLDSDSQNVKEVIKAYELIFPEESRREIDNMKLSFRDLMVVIQEAIKLIIGDASGGEH